MSTRRGHAALRPGEQHHLACLCPARAFRCLPEPTPCHVSAEGGAWPSGQHGPPSPPLEPWKGTRHPAKGLKVSPGRRRSLAGCEDTCSPLPTHPHAPVLSPWPRTAHHVPDADPVPHPGPDVAPWLAPRWSRQLVSSAPPPASQGWPTLAPAQFATKNPPGSLSLGAILPPEARPAACAAQRGHQPGSATLVLLPSTWPPVEPPELDRRLSTPLTPPTCRFLQDTCSVRPTHQSGTCQMSALQRPGGAGGLAAWPPSASAWPGASAQPRASGPRAGHFHRVLREVGVGLREDQECRARPR